MPVRLTPLEYALSCLNILPTPLLDTPLAPGIAKVLVTACNLHLFDLLDPAPLPLPALAAQVQSDPQGLSLLLHILVSAGYLRLHHGYYSNTRLSRRWLTTGSPANIAPYIIHTPDIIALWDHLPEVVRTNQQAARMPYTDDVENEVARAALQRHYAGLAALATVLGAEIVSRVHIPAHATRLLDVAGSHAAYSALLCLRHPALHATILDLEPGIEAGMRTASQLQLTERMSFVCADIVRDDFPLQLSAPVDVALYFQVAHLFSPELNQLILRKVVQTLKPGGKLIFVDQVTDQTHGSHLAAIMVQFMALTMRTVGGTCYPFATVRSWLEEAGLGLVRRHRLITPGATLITAIK